MNSPFLTGDPPSALREVIWNLVAGGDGVRDGVRHAVIRSLTRAPLTLEDIHEVLQPVLCGAADALQPADAASRRALAEAVDGLDDALAGAVQAMLQAGLEARTLDEECGGRALRHLVADLRSLEALLLESLEEARRAVAQEAGDCFAAVAGELRRTGTATGRMADHAVARIEPPLRRAPRRRPDAWPPVHAPQPQLGRAASRILAGLAEAPGSPRLPPAW